MVARANWTIEVFGEMGAPVPQSSRLRNARDLLLRLNNEELVLSADDIALQNRVAEANKTIWELFVIANGAIRCLRRASTPFCGVALRGALKGADLTTDDANNRARNTQFELYVAATLSMGGAEVSLGEPDFRLLYWGKNAGVAVKRLTSMKPDKLDERMKDAAGQVARYADKGFIAINVDALYRGLTRPRDEAARFALFNARMAEVDKVIGKRLGRAKDVKGVLVFGNIVNWSFDGDTPSLETSYPLSYRLIEDDDEPGSRERGEEFFSGLSSRLGHSLQHLRS